MITGFQDIIQEDLVRIADPANVEVLSDLRGETLLVTGGTGFIGTWIAELVAHLNDKHDFRTKIILVSGNVRAFGTKVPHLARRGDITLLERDVRSIVELPSQATFILHAAASPDNRQHASDPLKAMKVIAQGTESVLEAATRLPNLKRFVNVSSGLVAANVDSSAVNSAYVEAKRFAETLCAAYRSQHRLPILNARPFAFIGPYQLLDRPWAINNFIRDGLMGGPIRILGDGETVRSYLYPSDAAFWFLRIASAGVVGTSYHVGSPEQITLNRLAEKVASYFSPRPKIVSGASKEKNKNSYPLLPDLGLAESSLGLKITVDLDTALHRTIQWNKHP